MVKLHFSSAGPSELNEKKNDCGKEGRPGVTLNAVFSFAFDLNRVHVPSVTTVTRPKHASQFQGLRVR